MSRGAVAIRGYKVISETRHGGSFKSYRVRDEDHGEVLTLHILPRTNRRSPAARALLHDLPLYSALTNPQIARPRRIRADENFYIVEVERPEGESLETILARGRTMDPQIALRVIEDVLKALASAAGHGLYHGSIRPSCVIVDEQGRGTLDGFGYGALLPDTGDFYSRLAAEVPVPANQRHAKDVYATTALLHHLIEGLPPFDPADSRSFNTRVTEERWIGTRLQDLYEAVSPLREVGADAILGKIRKVSGLAAAPEPPVEGPKSLLDAVDEPADDTGKQPDKLSRWKRLAAAPTLPVLAAGLAGALIALTFGAPFLGTDAGKLPSVQSAISLPAATPLPPAEVRTEKKAETPTERVKPPKRSAEDEWRQMIVALAEIGDYPAALAALEKSEGRTREQISEERDAVIASARRRFDELREIGRALTAENHLADALREWDGQKAWWPEDDLAKSAEAERALLVREAETLRQAREALDRKRTEIRQKARFRTLVQRILLEERYDVSAQLKEIDAFNAAAPSDALALAARIGALRECVRRRASFFKMAHESFEGRRTFASLNKITTRFGAGEIVGMTENSVIIKPGEGSIIGLPLTRLDGAEKLRLLREVWRRADGSHSFAIGLFCISWGLNDAATQEFNHAESTADVPPVLMDFARRILKEE